MHREKRKPRACRGFQYRDPRKTLVTFLSTERRNLRYLKSNAAELGMRLAWRRIAQVSIAYPEAILRFSKLPWRESHVEESC